MQKLLIVPYGIETEIRSLNYENRELLIVPYGIETPHTDEESGKPVPFNRTLWN